MSLLEKQHTQTTPEHDVERLSPHTVELFQQADDFVDDLQMSDTFLLVAQRFHVEVDEASPRYSAPEYWNTVRFVAEQEISAGNYVGDPSLLRAMHIAAAAPDFIHKQALLETEDLNQNKMERAKLDVSTFNGYLRDFVAENPDTSFDSFIELLTAVASEGISKHMVESAKESMKIALVGVRTEFGFEQKATRANLKWVRGTAAQDLKGIDYIVEGLEVDIKSSLEGVYKNKSDSIIDKAYRIGFNRHVTLYPYDNVRSDYPDGTFRVAEENLVSKSQQLARDFFVMTRELA